MLRFAMSAMLLLSAVAAAAQDAEVPSLGATVEIEITNLDVVVTRRDGTHVTGLTKDDFVVLQDGKPQPVTHFAEYALGAKAGDEESRQPRSLLFFIEIIRLPDFRVEPFIDSLKTLTRTLIEHEGDRAAIVTFSDKAEMRIAPTNDVAAVEQALDNIAQEFLGVQHNELGAVAGNMNQLREFESIGAEEAATRAVARPSTSVRSMTASASSLSVIQAESRMKRRIAAATAAVHALAGVEGKKVLILATHRMGQLIGAEYVLVTGGSGNAVDNRQAVARLIANANAAGVTVYPVYPAGLDATPSDPGTPDIGPQILVNEMASLETIAENTGGLTTYGTRNVAELMPRVAADVANYYSLAYRSTDDEAHELEVRTKDRDLNVRARRQVIERTDAGRMRDRLLAALYEALIYSPIPVSASRGEPKKSGDTLSLPLTISVPIRDLTLLPGDGIHAGAFTVYLMSGASYGEASDTIEETRRIEIPSEKLESYQRGPLKYEVNLVVDPDAEVVAIGILDEVSKSYGVTTVELK